MTAFADLTAALAAALAAAPPIADLVERGVPWPMPEGSTSIVWIRPDSSARDDATLAGTPVDWTTTFVVEIRKRFSPDSESADASIDGIIGAVYARLAALSIDTVSNVTPATVVEWDFSQSDLNIIGASIRVEVVHRTQGSTLTA